MFWGFLSASRLVLRVTFSGLTQIRIPRESWGGGGYVAEQRNASQAPRHLQWLPPGLVWESLLGEAHTYKGYWTPSQGCPGGIATQVPMRSSIYEPLFPQPGTRDQLCFWRQSSGSLFHHGFHSGAPAKSTIMMRKTAMENNKLLADRHRQE